MEKKITQEDVDNARKKAWDACDKAQEKACEAWEACEKARDACDKAQEKACEAWENAQEKVKELERKFKEQEKDEA